MIVIPCTGATLVQGGCVWCGQSGTAFATGTCLPTSNNVTCTGVSAVYNTPATCPGTPASATSIYSNNFVSYFNPKRF